MIYFIMKWHQNQTELHGWRVKLTALATCRWIRVVFWHNGFTQLWERCRLRTSIGTIEKGDNNKRNILRA